MQPSALSRRQRACLAGDNRKGGILAADADNVARAGWQVGVVPASHRRRCSSHAVGASFHAPLPPSTSWCGVPACNRTDDRPGFGDGGGCGEVEFSPSSQVRKRVTEKGPMTLCRPLWRWAVGPRERREGKEREGKEPRVGMQRRLTKGTSIPHYKIDRAPGQRGHTIRTTVLAHDFFALVLRS